MNEAAEQQYEARYQHLASKPGVSIRSLISHWWRNAAPYVSADGMVPYAYISDDQEIVELPVCVPSTWDPNAEILPTGPAITFIYFQRTLVGFSYKLKPEQSPLDRVSRREYAWKRIA